MQSAQQPPPPDPGSHRGTANPSASPSANKQIGKRRPVRPRLPASPAEASPSLAASNKDFAARLDLVYDHNERAMTLPDRTHALLKRAQGDFFTLQAWMGDLLAHEVTNAPRSRDKLEELTPAIAKFVKLGQVIAQLEKVVAAYGSEAEVPAPRPPLAESSPQKPVKPR